MSAFLHVMLAGQAPLLPSTLSTSIITPTLPTPAVYECGTPCAPESSSQIASTIHQDANVFDDDVSYMSTMRPQDWQSDERVIRDIPEFVMDYAPYVHLFSGEEFWPSDIVEHLVHNDPYLNYTELHDPEAPRPNVDNLHLLNKYGRHVFLTSQDNVEDRPEWLSSKRNIPKARGHGHEPDGHSDAPAVLVVVDKGEGVVDAFWFFFYSYNLGLKVLSVRFGNHVGDWEHTMVRFKDGKPQAVFYSEHTFGQAYTYDAVEKIGKRPVSYSAIGSHAMYATPGIHRYILPWGLLHDTTDRGPLWDPSLNVHAYTWDLEQRRLINSQLSSDSPLGWFYFVGKWGDKRYPSEDSRQYQFAGQYHYVDGPTGPIYKNLGRKGMCQGSSPCEIRTKLKINEVRTWPGGVIGAEEVLAA